MAFMGGFCLAQLRGGRKRFVQLLLSSRPSESCLHLQLWGGGSGGRVENVCISHTHLLVLPLGFLSRKHHSVLSVAWAQDAVTVMPPWGLSPLSFCCQAQLSPPQHHLLVPQDSPAAACTHWPWEGSCQPRDRARSG